VAEGQAAPVSSAAGHALGHNLTPYHHSTSCLQCPSGGPTPAASASVPATSSFGYPGTNPLGSQWHSSRSRTRPGPAIGTCCPTDCTTAGSPTALTFTVLSEPTGQPAVLLLDVSAPDPRPRGTPPCAAPLSGYHTPHAAHLRHSHPLSAASSTTTASSTGHCHLSSGLDLVPPPRQPDHSSPPHRPGFRLPSPWHTNPFRAPPNCHQ
jgi:hypothetical protein